VESAVNKPWQPWRVLAVAGSGLNQRDRLVRNALWFVFLYAAAVIAIREPDLLTNPQFYAEGGTWYAQAYNQGWAHALLLTEGGYFAIFPKLIVGLSLLVPLQFAPGVMNLCGILLQALPVPILLSSRCSRWGTMLVRLFMAAVYLALPNAGEIHVVLTNAQWHLSLVACLLVLANPPGQWHSKLLDGGILLLCGLTGPFCLVLLPVAAVVWWKRRSRWHGFVCGLLAMTAILEGTALLSGGLQDRGQVPLGATPLLLAKMIAGQVYIGAFIGQNDFSNRAQLPAVLLVLLIGTSILTWCVIKGGWELRLFILFSALLLGAALICPMSGGRQPRWEFLATSTGGRYWFFPMLATSWSLIWCATECELRACRILAVAGMVTMLWGEVREWKYPPFADKHFGTYVQKLAAAPPGTEVTIPICPEGWNIELIKRRDRNKG
jgi:hypothetical protein